MAKNTVFTGKAWTFGDDINTESIMPTSTTLHYDLVIAHVLEHYDPEFAKQMKPGDFIVAGRNFANSSSRPCGEVLKMIGLAAVLCESCARIFYRNTWNIGVPVLECPELTKKVKKGDQLEVDIASGIIKNLTTGEVLHAEPAIEPLLQRWEVGGMVEWIRAHKEDYPTLKSTVVRTKTTVAGH